MIQKDGSKGKKKNEPRNTARWNRQKTKCQNLIRGKSAVGGNINLTRDTYSAPNSRWQNVYFPGTAFDYTGAYDYGSYGWFDNEQNPNPIKYFNVIHCYKHPEVGETVGEILNIETVYYD